MSSVISLGYAKVLIVQVAISTYCTLSTSSITMAIESIAAGHLYTVFLLLCVKVHLVQLVA